MDSCSDQVKLGNWRLCIKDAPSHGYGGRRRGASTVCFVVRRRYLLWCGARLSSGPS